MPLGWYLAQGMVPLGPSSSDDEEGPCELPNGRLVCGPHGLVSCGKCCTDYSFMDDVLSHSSKDDGEDDGEDDDSINSDIEATDLDPAVTPQLPATIRNPIGPELRRGTGRVFPTRFFPPSATTPPLELFSGRKPHARITRYTHRNDAQKVLIHTDGACLNNGKPNPKAGWAFWHGLTDSGEPAVASAPLEKKGPFGDDSIQSSNRAELRAVIAALRFRHWPGEGFRTFVVATDSEYTVEGSTKWAKVWVENGWTTRGGTDVKNKDLWEALLGEFERWEDAGMAVQFWRIPREWNTIADAAAKNASAEVDIPNRWTEMIGMNF